jgi:hypothetical protein
VTLKPSLGRLSDGAALNRCFPTKAVAVWHQLNEHGHMSLVEHYLKEAGNFQNIRNLARSPRRLFSDPLYAVVVESTEPST